MENLFKKLLYTSVGVVSQAKDKLEEAIQKLVEEDKLSTQEGKRIVDDFLNSTDNKKDEVEKEVSSLIERLVKAFSFATQTEIDELTARIATLEALIAKLDAKPLPAAKTEEAAEESTEDDEKKPAPKRRTTSRKAEE